jgi:predicted house-cleaning noncanonical NTP pyrophosphatase (MazG superfamily)
LTTIRRFRVEKLIRDKLPAIMRAQGLTVHDRRLEDDEYRAALVAKLAEEAAEAGGAAGDPRALLEELADVTEVILALLAAHGFTPAQLEAVRLAKREQRGGFDERVYNAAVSAPDGAPALNYYIGRPNYPEIPDPEITDSE